MLGRGWRAALASYLWAADANLLARHHSEFFGIKALDNYDIDLMEMRVDLLTFKADTCWEELELLCLNASKDQADPDANYGYALVEAIARFGDTDRALSILAEQIVDPNDYGDVWMELFMVNLAGEMRLDAAVPSIIAKSLDAEKEADLLFEEAESALVKIGTNAVVEGAATLFSQRDWIRRMIGCRVLRYVHSDLAVAKALELLSRENNARIKLWLSRGPHVSVRLRGCRTRAPIHSRRRSCQKVHGFAVGFDRGRDPDGGRIARKGTMAGGCRERSCGKREADSFLCGATRRRRGATAAEDEDWSK